MMRVHDIMTRTVEVIAPDAPLREAAARMRDLDLGALPVCDGNRLLGVLTDRDITVRAAADGRDPNVTRARDVMSPDVIYCFEDDLVEDASRVMEERQIRRLVVVSRDKELVGILSLGDIALNTGDETLAGQALERVSEPAPPALEMEHAPRSDDERERLAFTMRTVAGVFEDADEAQRALEDLRTAGIDPRRVSVVAQDGAHARHIASDTGAHVASGTATGAGLGLLFGGVTGWLIGVGALAIPGIGPIIAAGPIAAALGVAGTTAAAGAGAGAVAGGLVGALTSWGFSESEAREYESRVQHGDVLIAADVDEAIAPRAEEILRKDGADRVTSRKAA